MQFETIGAHEHATTVSAPSARRLHRPSLDDPATRATEDKRDAVRASGETRSATVQVQTLDARIVGAARNGARHEVDDDAIVGERPETARRQLWRDAARGLPRVNLERLPRGGEPTVGSTGITVGQVIGLSADGYDVGRIVQDFGGQIDREDIRQAITFAMRLASR